MIPLGGQAPHVRPMGVHRTCGGPNEIELTPIGTCGEPTHRGMAVLEAGARTHGRGHERVDRVELNGPVVRVPRPSRAPTRRRGTCKIERLKASVSGGDKSIYVWLSARVEGPHGAHVWCLTA